MTASLRILSSKADSNTWESFTRSGLKLETVHQESPHSDIFRKRATKPLLKQKHRQKHLVAMLSSGVGPLCFLKSTVNSAIYQEILEHFMLPSADKLYGDADFIFQQDFDTMPKVPKAGSMTMVLLCLFSQQTRLN